MVEEDIALLLQVLDLPVAPEALLRLSPEARQARTFTLLWHLLRQEAQQQPLVLVVEDVHWIDPTSAAWLTSLLDRLAGMAVLVLLTQRPGLSAAPGGARHGDPVRIAAPACGRQPGHRGGRAGHGPAPSGPAPTAGGARGGQSVFCRRIGVACRRTRPVPHVGAVPESVHAVLAARIDRLPLGEKRSSRRPPSSATRSPCACYRPSPSCPRTALQRGLTHLQAAEFLYETSLFPERVYTFKHALTQEVAYSGFLHERQRALHTRIVEPLEALSVTVWRARSNGWHTTPCGAKCGTRPWHTLGRPGKGAGAVSLPRGRGVVRAGLSVLPNLPETRHTTSGPSISGSTCGGALGTR